MTFPVLRRVSEFTCQSFSEHCVELFLAYLLGLLKADQSNLALLASKVNLSPFVLGRQQNYLTTYANAVRQIFCLHNVSYLIGTLGKAV